MRKRNQAKLFDNIMWYIIYLLPILITIIVYPSIIKGSDLPSSLDDANFWVILRMVCRAFGVTQGSFLPVLIQSWFPGNLMTATSPLVVYLSYFIACNILHLFVDFILFIPRLCHKWMVSFTQGD